MKKLYLTYRTVQRTVKQYQKIESTVSRKRIGRPKVAPQIRVEFNEGRQNQVSLNEEAPSN